MTSGAGCWPQPVFGAGRSFGVSNLFHRRDTIDIAAEINSTFQLSAAKSSAAGLLNHQVLSNIASLRNEKSTWIPPLDSKHCKFLNPRVASLLAHPFTCRAKSGISNVAPTHISQDMNYSKLSAATPIITQTRYQINAPDTIPSLPIPY